MTEINPDIRKVLGEALILAAVQVSIGSVEMSSKFSVINFSKDQETLDNACFSLINYIIIATIWTVGTSLLLYSQFGNKGLYASFISNLFIMIWIVWSYIKAFKMSAEKYKLKEPSLISSLCKLFS